MNQVGRRAALLLVLLCVTSPALAEAPSASQPSLAASPRTYMAKGWYVAESPNFQACCRSGHTHAVQLATRCEKLRAELAQKWLAKGDCPAWNGKCQVIVHATFASYVAASGRGSEQTLGSSLIEPGKNGCFHRRIDLRGDAGDYLTAALPHELTHIVLADRFGGEALPRWCDEGVAILADPRDKQADHERDLRLGLAGGRTFHTAELLGLDDYPAPDRWGVFYGQSASLVRYLLAQGDGDRFLTFLELADKQGHDTALRRQYQIDGVADLDRRWRRHVMTVAAKATTARLAAAGAPAVR